MKQQVLVIHGGTSFDSHEEYIDFIKTRELTCEALQQCEDWRFSLGRELGDGFEVLFPKMPNATNARYEEWCLWLERCLSFVRGDVILIGHSLGGIFLTKYLSEHLFPKRITATLLVAPPFDTTSTDESLRDFALPASLKKFEKQAGAIYLMYSQDDPIVPFGELGKYTRALPQAKSMVFDDRGHFRQATFPELVSLLKSVVLR